MPADVTPEDLLRSLAPQVLGVLVRRGGDFATSEDAVQEALITAAERWPADGVPDAPLAWLVRVASRRRIDAYRSNDRRRQREVLAASITARPSDPASGADDSLVVLFLCCHPSLTPAAAIPLTLRAVGGLTTREIAAAFLLPEATMAQRISRAKAKVKESGAELTMPDDTDRDERLRSVLHVLYLMFNEGYSSTSGDELARRDLSAEAIRLARGVHRSLPDDPEVTGLLALMLLNDARRPARTGRHGELVPLADQDRSRWDREQVVEGVRLVTEALKRGRVGEYQLQAAIAACHDQAPAYEDTDWTQIVGTYGLLERITGNPMVTLNRAVAVAMLDGPDAGLAALDGLDERLGDHHRLHAVRGHLLADAGRRDEAVAELRAAAAGTPNARERDHLTIKAAEVAHRTDDP